MLSHYENLAENFDRAWLFSEEYQSELAKKILQHLEFKPEDILVDIGAGTGSYTAKIHALGGGKLAPICVEPSCQMAVVAEKNHGLSIVREDALTFSRRDMQYDKVLVKETIHHIAKRVQMWRGVRGSLSENGRVLVVTRPQNIQWPLFIDAKKIFAQHQPATECLVEEMVQAGFSVDVFCESFVIRLPKQRWFDMLKARFISDLSRFSDEEIEAGITEIENIYQGDTIEVNDMLYFLAGSKAAGQLVQA